MKFTGHNIQLNNGEQTRPGNQLLADSAFMVAIKRTVINITGTDKEQYSELKLVDLACMEGGYATEFATMGFNTLGIDARKDNLLKANYVKLNNKITNLNFVLDDVRNLPKYGQFDITLCLGILYHLDAPADFLKMLYKQTNKLLIIHTFYAPEKDIAYSFASAIHKIKRLFVKKPKGEQLNKKLGLTEEVRKSTTTYIQHVKSYRLGPLTQNEGYAGRWYREWDKKSDKKKIEDKTEASYNNHRSFWLCKKDIIKALYDAGFSSVYEQLDDIDDLASKNPKKYYGRTMLVAVKN